MKAIDYPAVCYTCTKMKRILFILVILSVAIPLSAFNTMEARFGLLWMGNAEEESAPSPLITTAGAAIPFALPGKFGFQADVDLFGQPYLLSEGGRAVPAEIEYREVLVLGMMLNPAFTFDLLSQEKISLAAVASPSFILRIPTIAWDEGGDNRGDIAGYLFGSGRFFFPAVGISGIWNHFPRIPLTFRLMTFFPIFHLWDGEGLPLYDQLMVQLSFGFLFNVGKKTF